jgi:queuine tRNA-ribosyltransferase
MAGEMLGPVLATQHNLQFYQDTMRAARAAILNDEFENWRRSFTGRFLRDNDRADDTEETQRRTS